MSKKLIAIAFSDLHLNIWAKFNENNSRTLNGFKILEVIAGISHKKQVPALFCGDMFHKAENLDQDLALYVSDFIIKLRDKYPRYRIYAIEGNHDLKHINSLKNPTRGWISVFSNSNIIVLDPSKPVSIDHTMVYGISYIDHNIGLSEYLKSIEFSGNFKNILLLHTDYPGAKDTDGREVDSVENLNVNTLNRFDLVLCGHIHKPQRLSKKVYMLGSTNQQRRSDSNCKFGYWELYDDLTLKFIELGGYPKFIDVEDESEIKDDGNYYTILPKKTRVSVNNEHNISKQLSKKTLARKYMREKGIEDKDKKQLLIDILNRAESC